MVSVTWKTRSPVGRGGMLQDLRRCLGEGKNEFPEKTWPVLLLL